MPPSVEGQETKQIHEYIFLKLTSRALFRRELGRKKRNNGFHSKKSV